MCISDSAAFLVGILCVSFLVIGFSVRRPAVAAALTRLQISLMRSRSQQIPTPHVRYSKLPGDATDEDSVVFVRP